MKVKSVEKNEKKTLDQQIKSDLEKIKNIDSIDRKKEEKKKELNTIALTENIDRVELPSGYLFYDTDSITVRDIKFRELASITAASQSGKLEYLVDAINKCVLDFDIRDMTYGDFVALMYVLRMDMPVQLQLSFSCTSPKHMDMIEEAEGDEKIRIEKALEQTGILNHTNISFVDIDMGVKTYIKDGNFQIEDIKIRPNLVSDVLDVERIVASMDEDNEMAVTEQITKNRYASLIDNSYGKTLEEKTVFLEKWFDEKNSDENVDMFEVLGKFQDWENISSHGVKNSVTVSCEVCGQSNDISISFDPADFFPKI